MMPTIVFCKTTRLGRMQWQWLIFILSILVRKKHWRALPREVLWPESQSFVDKFFCSNGHLISKCLFSVLNFFQKMNENRSTWGIIAVKSNSFVSFWKKCWIEKNKVDFVWLLKDPYKHAWSLFLVNISPFVIVFLKEVSERFVLTKILLPFPWNS